MIAYVKLFQIYVLKLDATLVVRILFLDFVNSIFMQKYNSVKIPQKKNLPYSSQNNWGTTLSLLYAPLTTALHGQILF